MWLRSCLFLGAFLIIATQVQGLEYIEDIIKRANETIGLLDSGIDTGEPIFYNEGVALDYGNLNRKTFRSLSDNLKIAIAGTHKKLMSTHDHDDYDHVLSLLMQNTLIRPTRDESLKRGDTDITAITTEANVNGWFFNLIDDPEFLAFTYLQPSSPINMGKATKLVFNQLRGSCGDKTFGSIHRDIIHVAMLRYPQPGEEKFDLRHLTVWATVDCGNYYKNGLITAKYTKREFQKRDAIISRLPNLTKKKGLEYIEEIFGKIEPKPEPTPEPQHRDHFKPMPIPLSSTRFSVNSLTVFMSTAAALLTTNILANRNR